VTHVSAGRSTSSHLAIITEHHGQRSVLRLQGELDAANEDHLRCAIRTALDQHGPHVLVLDLSALGFTDCAGLSAIVWAHKHLAGRGHELVLTGIQPFVRRLLNVTGLNRYLHLSTSETPLVTHVDAGPRHHARTEESGLIQAPE
jgi:anti-sigma B factor antagonist/stage II sporulation protein AA (anti-sigma F factor antagonist)